LEERHPIQNANALHKNGPAYLSKKRAQVTLLAQPPEGTQKTAFAQKMAYAWEELSRKGATQQSRNQIFFSAALCVFSARSAVK
jgi:hypothetical protein